MSTFSFTEINGDEVLRLTSIREGEQKIGQAIAKNGNQQTTKFVVLGISEDFGPQANQGFPGSANAFDAFLSRFLNMQSNRFIKADEILVIGKIVQHGTFKNVADGRNKIEELDELVHQTLAPWVDQGKIPIVVGGGHNNAYPIIKTIARSQDEAIEVVNLDPHADCRPIEGRHSGNPFSFAAMNGYLDKYTVIGLHKAYNSEYILDFLDLHKFDYYFFEDMIDHPLLFTETIQKITANSKDKIGIELDLDCIKGMPSSAFTPSGFSVEQARYYIRSIARNKPVHYLHLPEGAPSDITEEKIIGKTLAYLVHDFISTQQGK